MKKNSNAARAARRELLATTMLATLAMSPVVLSFGALAQTANPPPAENSGGAIALPTVEVTATQTVSRPSAPKAPPEGYIVHNSSTGTKTDTPLILTPLSVKVIPRAVIEDRKVTRVQEALENVSGVQPIQSIGGGTGFTIRGFADSRKMFRNGLLATSPTGFRTEFDAANVEQIEVIKGPAAMLYGRFEPGGLINIVTKRPLDVPYHAVEQRFGSFGHYFTLWDATGPVNEDGSLLYRFSGGYENSGSFRDFQHINRVLLNPSITARLTPDTDFTVDFEYFNQDYFGDFGLPAIGNRPAPIPISRSLDDPNDPRDNFRTFRVGSELTHRFNEYLTLRNRFLASFLHSKDEFANPTPAFGSGALLPNGVLRRNIFGQISDAEVYTTNLDLLGHFDLLGAHHETLVGFDYLRADAEYSTFGDSNKPNPAFDINIFNPIYNIPRKFFDAAPFNRPGFPRDRNVFLEDQKGAYFQDHITIWDQLHIFGGGRYDWSEVGRGRGGTLSEARANLSSAFPSVIRKDNAFSPRVGVLFQPLPWASVYGSWTTSFGANNGVDKNNNPQPPQQAEQFETGVKTELFDNRLLATLAFYHLVKTNILTRDFSSPDPTVTIAIGQQRSKGIEFDATGKITDSLSLIGSLTYLDARVIKDNTFDAASGQFRFLGHRLPNVPRYAGSLWLKWDVKEIAELDGLSLGLGAYVVGIRQGDPQSTFQLPGYVRFDALAAYRWKVGPTNVIAQINLRNLTNTKYYESADQQSNVDPRFGIFAGAPITVIGSLKMEF